MNIVNSYADIGIIGGSDGPTTIFVSGDVTWLIVSGIILIAALVGIIIITKKRSNQKKSDKK